MSTMGIVVLVVALVAAVLLVVGVILRYTMRVARTDGLAVIESEFGDDLVLRSDPMANYFGFASHGAQQLRGNGALVLTPKMLWFKRFRTDLPLDLPLAAIRGVDIVDAHAGKRIGRPLLRVTFATDKGDDSVAWYVRDAEAWLATIEEVRAD